MSRKEIWRPIKDYPNYEVSNLGQVKNIKTGKILKSSKDKKGYNCISLWKNNKSKSFRKHRLVAEAFIPNPNNLPCVDHIIPVSMGGTDEASNLRWVTYTENNNNPLTKENMSKGQIGKKMPDAWVEKQINRRKGKEWVREENPAFKGWIVVLYPNGEVSDKMTRLEASKMLGMSRTTIDRLLKTKEVYKVTKYTRGNIEHLRTLEGIKILKYEDYLKEGA